MLVNYIYIDNTWKLFKFIKNINIQYIYVKLYI